MECSNAFLRKVAILLPLHISPMSCMLQVICDVLDDVLPLLSGDSHDDVGSPVLPVLVGPREPYGAPYMADAGGDALIPLERPPVLLLALPVLPALFNPPFIGVDRDCPMFCRGNEGGNAIWLMWVIPAMDPDMEPTPDEPDMPAVILDMPPMLDIPPIPDMPPILDIPDIPDMPPILPMPPIPVMLVHLVSDG